MIYFCFDLILRIYVFGVLMNYYLVLIFFFFGGFWGGFDLVFFFIVFINDLIDRFGFGICLLLIIGYIFD